MQFSQIPKKIALAFANGGAKSAIPVDSQIGKTAGAASYTDGFPPLTRTPLAAGGVPPKGTEMNGILYETTSVLRYLNAGGVFPFDTDFANLIGGYPKGAVVAMDDVTWRSLVDNNTAIPNSGIGWTSDHGSFQSALVLFNARTLTAADVGKIIISAGNTSFSIPLPLISTVSVGGMFNFLNVSNKRVTVVPQGANAFIAGVFTIPSIPLDPGETLQIANEGNNWYVVGGSASMKYSQAAFGALLVANGSYTVHPSGMIEQSGYVITDASGLATINYPIAFPNNPVSGALTVASSGAYYSADFDENLGIASVKIRLNSPISLRVYYKINGY